MSNSPDSLTDADPLKRVSPLLLAVGSLLFPTSGLFALGRIRRAAAWLGALAAAALVFAWLPQLAMIVMPVAWLGAVVDTYLSARRFAPRWRRGQVLGIWLAVAGALFCLRYSFRAGWSETYRIASGEMAPTFISGDHVIAEKVSLWFRDPAAGEVVVFDFPCQPGVNFVKRIVALSGDTVEVRCNLLYVNGQAVPTELDATGECLLWDYDETRSLWTQEPCSRYRETLGNKTFATLYAPERPEVDSELATVMDYRPSQFEHDFPSLEGGSTSEWLASAQLPGCRTLAAQAGPPLGQLVLSAGAEAGSACAPKVHYVVPDGHVFVMGDNRVNFRDSRIRGPVPLDDIKGRVTAIWWSSQRHPAGGIDWGRIGRID